MGILLYLSSDLPKCQYVIRYLSTCASKRTQKAMTILKDLVDYMAGHPEEYVSLKWKGIHSGLLRDYECEEPVLEIFSDADWAADRTSRRSVSGSAIFYGGCLIYSSSRTQKIVPLSSAESETYAVPLQLSWMPFSLGQSYAGHGQHFRFAFSCISFWIHQLQGEFYHVVVLIV